MLEVLKSATFESWFSHLRDRQAQARINARIRRLSLGNPGDVKPVGSGVSELRIDYGPGYRVYFMQRARYSGGLALRRGQANAGCGHQARDRDREELEEVMYGR